MLKNLIAKIVSCFPEGRNATVAEFGPTSAILVDTLEDTIESRQCKVMNRIVEECEQVKEKVIKEEVRKQLFAMYNIDEQALKEEHHRNTAYGGYPPKFEIMLVDAILKKMVEEVLKCMPT
jgi:hypothetical protein